MHQTQANNGFFVECKWGQNKEADRESTVWILETTYNVHLSTCHWPHNVFYHIHITFLGPDFISRGGWEFGGVAGDKAAKPVTAVRDCVSTVWADKSHALTLRHNWASPHGHSLILICHMSNCPFLFFAPSVYFLTCCLLYLEPYSAPNWLTKILTS